MTLLTIIITFLLTSVEFASNTALLMLTILSSNLHTTCNLLIALEALCIVMLDMSGLIMQPFVFPMDSPITLVNCFLLNGFFVFWYELLTTMPFVIALERFLNVFCPIWTRNYKLLHATMMFGIGIGHSTWFMFGLIQTVISQSNKQLICKPATLYFENQSAPGSNQYIENALVFVMIGAAILLYVFIWFQRPRKSFSNDVQVQLDRRFFRCICFIVFMMCLARLTPALFAFVTPLVGWGEDVHSTICTFIMKLPQASPLIILYIYGSEYKKAVDKLLNKMGIKRPTKVHSIQITRQFFEKANNVDAGVKVNKRN